MAKPKILLFDIETSPNLAYVWGKYEQDVIAFEDEFQILSIAWKWLGEDRVHCTTMAGSKSDVKVCKTLHTLLAKADVVIAHNGDAFDLKKARARFISHGMPPLKALSSVDTLKIARKYFKFNSNKLDDLGASLNLGRKTKMSGFDTWLGCMKDNMSSWAKMVKYNKQDVVLLEKVYKKMLPWIENHPSIAALKGNPKGCPNCGSHKIVKYGVRPNKAILRQRFICKDCGAHHLGGKVK